MRPTDSIILTLSCRTLSKQAEAMFPLISVYASTLTLLSSMGLTSVTSQWPAIPSALGFFVCFSLTGKTISSHSQWRCSDVVGKELERKENMSRKETRSRADTLHA